MRSKFTDQTMIFRKDTDDRTFYSATISKKKADGEYENAYIRVEFKKGTDLPNKTLIDIKNGWLTFYIKDKIPQWYVFVNEYEIVDKPEVKPTEIEGFASLSDDQIPF